MSDILTDYLYTIKEIHDKFSRKINRIVESVLLEDLPDPMFQGMLAMHTPPFTAAVEAMSDAQKKEYFEMIKKTGLSVEEFSKEQGFPFGSEDFERGNEKVKKDLALDKLKAKDRVIDITNSTKQQADDATKNAAEAAKAEASAKKAEELVKAKAAEVAHAKSVNTAIANAQKSVNDAKQLHDTLTGAKQPLKNDIKDAVNMVADKIDARAGEINAQQLKKPGPQTSAEKGALALKKIKDVGAKVGNSIVQKGKAAGTLIKKKAFLTKVGTISKAKVGAWGAAGLGAAYGVKEIYKNYMRKAARECEGKHGDDKKLCMQKYIEMAKRAKEIAKQKAKTMRNRAY